jgi:AAA domain-containing protein
VSANVSIESSLLTEILEWSEDRPGWQRDALHRLFTKGELDATDIAELVEISKSAHGLVNARASEPLTKNDLAIADASTEPISLVSITHRQGVNALAAEQTVAFGANLTIVYGENAAGKSGYIRILKQACRSRYTEKIIGNVLSGTAPQTPHATIRIREGGVETVFEWSPKAQPSQKLAAVSIFDAHCVPIYLKDKTDVAFRPFGLDVFDNLSAACGDVRLALEKERSTLNASATTLPVLADGTVARRLVDGLTSLTSSEAVRICGTLTSEDKVRLLELRKLESDFQSPDPKKLAQDLTLRADRVESLDIHLANLEAALGDEALASLGTHRSSAENARQALASIRDVTMAPDLLPGTGGDQWKRMWDAGRTFSAIAYAGREFPQTQGDAKCVLCQQQIGNDAVTRFKHFAEYVTSTAQAELVLAESRLAAATQKVLGTVVERTDIALTTQELALDDAAAASKVSKFIDKAKQVKAAVGSGSSVANLLPTQGVGIAPRMVLAAISSTLRKRARELQSPAPRMELEDETELKELGAREKLSEDLDSVLKEIERKKRLAAYTQCLDDASTNAITKKSTELTKRLVTDTLRKTFANELQAVEFTHLDVEIQPAGGSKGALFHRLVFTHAPSVVVADVLSEGEARALSLAAFLTELSTATIKSTIVFDDPVSSLDHIWRERIARRLVKEAACRQVIIFTHDLLFLHFLMAEAGLQNTPFSHQYIRRQGQAGICLPDLPWVAMLIKERIGVLKKRLQAADKTFRTEPDRYEVDAHEIYGLLREAWEQAVGEVLLNNVVERYRPSIETNRVKKLYDITQADCETVEREMTECSRWIRGHDAAPADATPIPDPDKVRERLEALDSWVTAIRKRRQA